MQTRNPLRHPHSNHFGKNQQKHGIYQFAILTKLKFKIIIVQNIFIFINHKLVQKYHAKVELFFKMNNIIYYNIFNE